MNDLLDRIWETKNKNCLLFAYPQPITESLLRWVDENNPQHYNKNHFLALEELSAFDLQAAVEFQKQAGLQGFLLKSRKRLSNELIVHFGLKEEKQLLMAQLTDRSAAWKTNPAVQIKDCQSTAVADDLMVACVSLTEDPNRQRWIRHTMEEALEAARRHPNYHWLVAYEGGQVIGRCYAFADCGCVQMEDLWVTPHARQRHAATTLMKYVRDHFDGLFFLHTEAEDSVKSMYGKLGFEIVDEVYEYSKVWGNPHE